MAWSFPNFVAQALIGDPINRDPINRMSPPEDQTLGDMLSVTVSNSHLGKQPVARDMIIFGSHVGAHVSGSVNDY